MSPFSGDGHCPYARELGIVPVMEPPSVAIASIEIDNGLRITGKVDAVREEVDHGGSIVFASFVEPPIVSAHGRVLETDVPSSPGRLALAIGSRGPRGNACFEAWSSELASLPGEKRHRCILESVGHLEGRLLGAIAGAPALGFVFSEGLIAQGGCLQFRARPGELLLVAFGRATLSR